jgi:hypothetical protein
MTAHDHRGDRCRIEAFKNNPETSAYAANNLEFRGVVVCCFLHRSSRSGVVEIRAEVLVDPISSVMSAPHLSPEQSPRDRASGQEDSP